ncbi:hypothetical protein Syun_013675 [Stephania yunnanensis]|uniref:Uncharacterized protein n=1 Tax=Stephania yunnanensis TaxID=152371 RepID=A0AAP0JIM9_9MAGN
MADIAILVAEEYERRTKYHNKKRGTSGGSVVGVQESSSANLGTGVAVSAKRIDVVSWVKKIEGENKVGVLAKSPLTDLAINGVFSA